MTALPSGGTKMRKNPVLYDHVPYPLNTDDYMRVCKIPKRKVSSFDSLPYMRYHGLDFVLHSTGSMF